MPFKRHKIIFFPEKSQKEYVGLPYLKFSDPSSETHLFFYLALSGPRPEIITITDYI